MIGIWKEKIEQLETKINFAQKEIEKARQQAADLTAFGRKYANQIHDFFQPQFESNQRTLDEFLSYCLTADAHDWNSTAWESWEPPSNVILNDFIRIGANVELRGDRRFAVPHFAPFIGDNRTLIIGSSDNTAEDAISLLQSLAIRIALTLPHQARFTLIDPVGGGSAFPMQRFLPFVRETSDDIRRDLDQVNLDIRRIIASYIDANSDSFESLPEEIRINERLEFIFAANFPRGYDRRAIEAMYDIGRIGPKAGKYLVLHYNDSHELPRDMELTGKKGFENLAYIDLANGYGKFDPTACQLKFIPDVAPSANLQTELFNKLAKAKPPQRNLAWKDTVDIPQKDWWKESASEIIETPVGGYGSSEFLKIWFGEDSQENTCAHGILGGTAGSGKSTLYHVIIMGLAIRYAPNELKMYLVDGKSGVTFQPYRDLPHAEVVSLHTMPELSRSVLAELVAEMDYRYDLFSAIGVEKLADYNKKTTAKKLPRILLLVDEYQELFEGDQDGIASSYLLNLSQQGRAAGIHFLLGSQGFSAVGMLNRDAIFQNIHLMMAMRMRPDDIQSLTSFGRRGKSLIMTCDLPGKIVLNDRLGDDAANKLGKVAFLKSEEREKLVQELHQKAHTEFSPDDLPLRIVLDGKEQPNLIENPQLRNLLEHSTWLTPQQWQTKARQSRQENGLGIPDWFSAERPRAVWLGQEFSVRGQAMIMLRRRIAENAVLVGSESTAIYGMLSGILTSLALNTDPTTTEFYIFDRSMMETQWCEALKMICTDVLKLAGFSPKFMRDTKKIGTFIDVLITELDRRIQLDDDERIKESSIFVIMTELDQVDELRRQADAYGMTDSPLGEKLRRLWAEGSRLGIHLILSFSGLKAMLNVMDDRQDLIHFRHRVALQMSEDDSFTFVRNRLASRLQVDGKKPISALYLDVDGDRAVRFKPYSTESTIPLNEQMNEVAETLKQWSQKS